ncbi:PAS domain S-box protein [Myxococcota bacterium]|nr:PAS domain S-box protein [Myxococcota bacterium]
MAAAEAHPGLRVLVVDDDALFRAVVGDLLRAHGFAVDEATTGEDGLAQARIRAPDLVLLDMMLPDLDGVEVCRQFKAGGPERAPPVIAVSALDGRRDVDDAYGAGVDDYLVKPPREIELIARVEAQIRARADRLALLREKREQEILVELSHVLAGSPDVDAMLDAAAGRLAEALSVWRCSILLVDEEHPGWVVLAATSDSPAARGLRLDLDLYPEVREVLQSARPLVLPDVRAAELLRPVATSLRGAPHDAAMLFPILDHGHAVGALFVRDARGGRGFSEREANFGQIVANAIAPPLRNARLLRDARDESARERELRAEAERRLERQRLVITALDGAPVGLAAVDSARSIRFVNATGAALLGRAGERLEGVPVAALFAAEARGALDRLWDESDGSEDLPLALPGPPARLARIAFTASPDEATARIAVFQDVTDQAFQQEELRRTTVFLENLIQRSPDAIVVADRAGRIRVFNDAAARLFGWAADEVVGAASVERLYPQGGAREVMRRMRSGGGAGGRGHVDGLEFEIVARDGTRIPVSLSAAMLFDDRGAVVATVGIFHDLREKREIEKQLRDTTDLLVETEKTAALVALAGAAAHELNQPLTAIMGMLELAEMRGTVPPESRPLWQGISREADRMAAIVRRIGGITRFSTRAYVGATEILDLKGSSE